MNKLTAFTFAAKLADAIAALPDDAEILGYTTTLNIDSKPFTTLLQVHLKAPLSGYPAVNGKQYSGWTEKRVWLKPDVFVWWAEETNDGNDC